MKKKNYNYKFVIGIIIGLIAVSGVSAATILSSNVYYKNEGTDVQSAIDYLAKNINPDTCPDGYYCVEVPLHLGDYVSYTPTVTSYTTDPTKTGYATQRINPSELNLWRVLNINDDGTVEIISEYVSSVNIIFRGQTGYLNFVGYLNVLASQYENSTYTVGSRHFGYDRYKSQTQYITDTSKFTSTAPWTSDTGSSTVESQGGGDDLSYWEINRMSSIFHSHGDSADKSYAAAYKVGTTTVTPYWFASRYYEYNSSTSFGWGGRLVQTDGSRFRYALYNYNSGTFNTLSPSAALRPIVTLKSGLKYTGEGTAASPWQISV